MNDDRPGPVPGTRVPGTGAARPPIPGRLLAVTLLPALLLAGQLVQPGPAGNPASGHPPVPSATPALTPPAAAPAAAPAPPVPATPAGPAVPAGSALGVLLDEVTGKPIAGAEISVPELGLRARSQADGRWSLPGVPARRRAYEVLVTCPGYSSVTVEVKVETAQPVPVPAIQLKPRGW